MPNRLSPITILLALLLCCAAPAEPQSCIAAPSGLVGWWPGDANENDIIGEHNPVSVNAVTLVPGEAKNGFTFGTEGYIEIPASPALANPEFTWAAWVRPDGPGPNNDQFGSVIVQQDLDDFNGISIWWRATDGRFSFYFGNINSVIYSTDSFAAGTFYFVSANYDGQTYRLYVNGMLEASLSAGLGTYSPSNPWMIGSTQPSFFPLDARTWNGVIDEVQGYNRALSLSEIQAIYAAGKAGVCKGLTFSPDSLRFPRRTVGATSPPLNIIVTNAFPLPVKIGKIAASGDFAQTNTCPKPPAALAPAATCTASVTFTPTADGTRTGQLTFHTNAPIGPQSVRLTGLSTDLAFSVAQLNFGSHALGTTSAVKTVTVTNAGSETVNFTGNGIALAGTDPADFLISATTCGPSLASGATCTVSIRFAPTATGGRNAAIQFNDDGGASPQTVSLTGTGTA